MCTTYSNRIMYGSWDMESDGHNFLSFWTIFCFFTPLKSRKIKILKKRNKLLEILSFYTSVPKIMIICYTVPEIWRVMDVIVIFHFELFFALLPRKSKFQKNEKKNPLRYYHFTHVYQQLWLDEVQFLRYGAQRTDGQTDGWTEKKTYRGGWPT